MLSVQKLRWSMHGWLLLTAFGLFLLLMALLTYINNGSLSLMVNFPVIIREGKIIFLGIIMAVYWVNFATRYFDKLYKNNLLVVRRFVFEFLVVVFGGFLINYFFHYLFIKLIVVPDDNPESLKVKLNNLLVTNQVLMVIIYAVIAAFKAMENLKEKEKEITRIEKELLQSQFETLKNQLNPHFLFNSLSSLASLVHADATKAEIFIDKLSRTYRYLLDQREKEIVPIEEEINFFQNFSYLVQQRYHKRLLIQFSCCGNLDGLFLLPHSFLIIIEHIIATNSMTEAQPLIIEVSIKNNLLLIRHNVADKNLLVTGDDTQQRELQRNYQRLGKNFVIQINEFEQTALYKISIINGDD